MARDFNGATDRIDFASVATLTASPVTISVWFNADVLGAGFLQYIFNASIATNSGGIILGLANEATGQFSLLRAGATALYRYSAAGLFAVGTWYHILATHDGTFNDATTIHLYRNGIETAYAINQNGVNETAPSGLWSLAGRAIDDIRNYNGRIAEVGAWNRVLSTGEIELLADGYSPLFVPSGLLFYPDLIAGTGQRMGATATVIDGTTVAVHPRIFYPAAPIFKWSNREIYTSTLTGVLAPTGALVNQAQKILAGSLSPTGALVKQGQKILTGTMTSSGALLKQTQKVLSGSLAPTGALLKQTQKVLVGSLAPTGALLKQTQKVLVGSLAPTGVLLKQTWKILSGALAPFGTLVAVFIPPAIAVAANEMFKSMWNGITKRMRGH